MLCQAQNLRNMTWPSDSHMGQRPQAANSDYKPNFLGRTFVTCYGFSTSQRNRDKEMDRETERGDLGVGIMVVKFPTKRERNVLDKTGFDL